MKTAVLLFGHVRTFAKVKEKYISLFEKLNSDIFIHTWDVYGFSTNGDDSRCHTPGLYSERFNIEPRWDTDIIDFNLFADIKNVKACVIEHNSEVMPAIYEKSLKYKVHREHEHDHPGNIISCNRKIYLANQLLKDYSLRSNINYDKVIVLRFDIEFDENIFLVDTSTKLNAYNGPYGLAAHISVFGTPEQVSKYADIYNHFDFLIERGAKFNPHTLDRAYFNISNIEYNSYDRLSIVR